MPQFLCDLQYNYILCMNGYCFTPNEQYLSYIMVKTNYIRWDDDDVLFVLYN